VKKARHCNQTSKVQSHIPETIATLAPALPIHLRVADTNQSVNITFRIRGGLIREGATSISGSGPRHLWRQAIMFFQSFVQGTANLV